MLDKYRFRTPKTKIALVVFVAAWALFFAEQAGWLNGAGQFMQTNQPGLYTVTRFSDGDTIVIDMNGKKESIRFIGVDTPETHKPNAPVQCYGTAASAYTKNVIGNKKVKLVADPLSTNRDRYDRLLRYVYLTDGTFMNQRLVEEGFGFYYPHFPFTKSKQFESAQLKAQAANKGVWGNCTPKGSNDDGWISNDL